MDNRSKLNNKEIVKFYNFLMDYESIIKKNPNDYDVENDSVTDVINSHNIYLGSFKKVDKENAAKSSNYILFSQGSCKNASKKAYHLMRHIRNAFAHGRIKKTSKGIKMEDKDKTLTMIGLITRDALFELLSALQIPSLKQP